MTNKLRRKLGAGLALALPATWIKPVVNNVVLPAHAFTTQCGVIRVTFTVETTGGPWEGDGSYSISGDSTDIDEQVNWGNSLDFSEEYELAPGSYSWSIGGGMGTNNPGTARLVMGIACCDSQQSVEVDIVAGSGGDGGGDGNGGQLIINPDGSCELCNGGCP